MEMKVLPIAQRLSSMFGVMPFSILKAAEFSPQQYKKMKTSLLKLKKKQPFWLVDGNMNASMDQIYMICNQLKPDVVYIDGAYLVNNPSVKLSSWEKAKAVVEYLKQTVCSNLNVPLVASYQFNREGAKKKFTKGLTSKDMIHYIGMTEAIAQVSSISLGLFEEESATTLAKRKIDIIKGRSGEYGSFRINWDFIKMNFSEVEEDYDVKMENI
jgi:hypothetical protein